MKNYLINSLLFCVIGLSSIAVCAQTSTLESLYQSKQFFALRDEAAKQRNVNSTNFLFYRGAVANKFNRSKESSDLLQRFIKSAKSGDEKLSDAYEMLADNYAKTYQYARAAEIYKLLLDKFGKDFDEEKKRDIESSYKTWSAASNVAPQTIFFAADTRLRGTRDKAALLNIPVEINNQKMDFVFDTGANLSTVTASTAAKLNLRIVETDISVGTSTDKRVISKLGVAPELKIGNVTLKNVVFLVLADSELNFPQINYQINGIVGFPVIEAFRQITITKNDDVFIPMKPEKLKTEQNLCLDDLKPLLLGHYKNQLMIFAFDTGAVTTTFYPAFFKAQETEIKKSGKQQTIRLGGAGGSNKFNVYVLDKLLLQVSGKTAKFDNAKILTEPINDESRYFYGNIGQDLIKQFAKMTLDFSSMQLVFE